MVCDTLNNYEKELFILCMGYNIEAQCGKNRRMTISQNDISKTSKQSNEFSKWANGRSHDRTNSKLLVVYHIKFFVQCWFITYNGLQGRLSENDIEKVIRLIGKGRIGQIWSNIVKRSNLGGLYGLAKGLNIPKRFSQVSRSLLEVGG